MLIVVLLDLDDHATSSRCGRSGIVSLKLLDCIECEEELDQTIHSSSAVERVGLKAMSWK